MSLIKYMERIDRIHRLIESGATGSCDEFALKLGISRRHLLENLREFKDLGAPLIFDHGRGSYVYEGFWSPFIVKLKQSELRTLRGGKNYAWCDTAALCFSNIAFADKFIPDQENW